MSIRNDVVNVALDAGENPYLMGGYAPVDEEIDASDLEVIGEIPADLNGLYVRNGPNPRFRTEGRYHWFDGDAMLHAIHLRDGQATYRNRWVRTDGFAAESAAGTALWRGMAEPRTGNPDDGSRLQLKDTANTDVVFHNGSLVALWYLAGEPYRIDPISLATLGKEDWQGTRQSCVSSHAKVDRQTGELLFFDYGPTPPYMSYGVVSRDGVLKHFTPIDLPGARMPHDMAITERHTVLMDLPLVVDPEAANEGRHSLVFRRDWPSRFAVVPRYGSQTDVRWFEADPCYIYHTVNAWEEDGVIVMTVCRFRPPQPPKTPITGPLASILNYLRLDAHLYRYRFDLRTGATTEQPLDDRNTEFPVVSADHVGRRNRYAYNVSVNNDFTMYFDGVVKYDLATGASDRFEFGPGRFGSEAPFAARDGASPRGDAEDDGYLVSFVYDASVDRSELVILDARDVAAGPVGRVLLPKRVPNGFHACWVPEEQLAAHRSSA